MHKPEKQTMMKKLLVAVKVPVGEKSNGAVSSSCLKDHNLDSIRRNGGVIPTDCHIGICMINTVGTTIY